MSKLAGLGKLRRQRRTLLVAIYGTCALAMGAAFAAAPGGARGPAATAPARPAVVSAADKAAAEAAFDRANALYQQKKYAEAQVENDKALKLDPTNVNAVLLQSTLKDKLAGGGTTPTTGTAATAATGDGKLVLLTQPQISLIRLMELGAADTRVNGKVDAKVAEEVWQNVVLKDPLGDKSQAAHDAFVKSTNFMGQARRIRDSHDMKYMAQVTVTTDPATFVAFKSSVQNYVLQNCATSECHGGEKSPGGGFHLLNPASSAEQQYTNFYILNQFGNADGQMINRESPDKSLLLQYALPWANPSALTKHPKIDVKKLTGTNDTRARPIVDWIRSLAAPKPNYGIDYAVPGAPAAATAPK